MAAADAATAAVVPQYEELIILIYIDGCIVSYRNRN